MGIASSLLDGRSPRVEKGFPMTSPRERVLRPKEEAARYEIFQELRAIDPSVPVVLGCGFDFPAEGLAEGFAGLLRKPYRAAEFQGLLQRTTLQPTQPDR